MYSKIIVCLTKQEDEVLGRQISMLKERHHAEVVRIDADAAASYIAYGDASVLFISDDKEIAKQAADKGIAVNDPQKMRESYDKAMEMLKAMGMKR